MTWTYRWIAGPDTGRSGAIPAGRHVLGRSPLASICSADAALEPHHALVEVDVVGTAWLTPLGGPTFVDGAPVDARRPVTHGARVRAGGSVMEWSADPVPDAAAAPEMRLDPRVRPALAAVAGAVVLALATNRAAFAACGALGCLPSVLSLVAQRTRRQARPAPAPAVDADHTAPASCWNVTIGISDEPARPLASTIELGPGATLAISGDRDRAHALVRALCAALQRAGAVDVMTVTASSVDQLSAHLAVRSSDRHLLVVADLGWHAHDEPRLARAVAGHHRPAVIALVPDTGDLPSWIRASIDIAAAGPASWIADRWHSTLPTPIWPVGLAAPAAAPVVRLRPWTNPSALGNPPSPTIDRCPWPPPSTSSTRNREGVRARA